MFKAIAIVLSLFFATSCIPLKIAPNIEGAKVYTGKKFKKGLPKKQVYVFEDPKEANDFYYFLNTKFNTDYDIFGGNVPVIINGRNHFLSFYEIERTTQTVNLLPIVVDAALENKTGTTMFENNYESRSGFWYIALTVSDDALADNLNDEYPQKESIIKYLDHLRNEYLTTDNYLDLVFKK